MPRRSPAIWNVPRGSSTARRASCSTWATARAAAGHELIELAEKLGAPVATTIQGKGVFPEQHPLWLWNGLGATVPASLRTVADSCDTMLAIGCRFAEVGTGSYGFTPPPTVVHVDINPEVFGRNVPTALAVEADAAAFVHALLPLVNDRGQWGEAAEQIANGHRLVRGEWARDTSDARVTPAALFAALQRIAPEAIYTTDSGNGTFLAMEHLRLDRPGRFLAPVDFSCMGYSVPAAIGAALANPGRDVVALAGDGAFLMTGLELTTAASYGAGVVVCLLRDGELAQIAQFQRTAMAGTVNSTVASYDVKAFAQTTGASYVACARDAQLDRALEEAFAVARGGRPVIVDVAIDYSNKTHFTRGVVKTNFWRLPWAERLRMLGRAASRHLAKRLGSSVRRRWKRRPPSPSSELRFASRYLRLPDPRLPPSRIPSPESRVPNPESRIPNVMLPRCTSRTVF